ncbi:ABC transporter substrate-binding protein [Kribbella sp. NPDC004875]|uniref:ABC transporter substrate-binding protein n=1 Tax=Kribbella sp. NPDC004875 TaxID=3364107 RepID=UPI0036AD5B90
MSALLLAGCSSTGNAAEAQSRLTVGLSSTVDCLDPHQTPNTPPLHVARQFVDSLTDQDPASGRLTPWLATSWTANSDATVFTFTLRERATFSDGTAVDAAAVVANLKDVAALGAKSPLGAGYLRDFAGATATGANRVTVRFAKPNAQFLQATSMVTLGLLSTRTLSLDSKRRCAGELVGSGPFVLKSVDENEEIKLVRRDGYDWAGAQAKHMGPAHLAELDFSIVPDASARHGSLASGQLDVDTQVLQQDERSFGTGGSSLLSATRPGIVYTLLPNESRLVLQDPAVRRAIAAGIDRSAFAPLLSKAERAATSALASTTPGYTDQSSLLRYAPDEAKRLLDSAGWSGGPGGIRTKQGRPLALTLVYSATERYGTVYQLMAQQLREIGVDLQLKPLDDATNNARQAAGDYDFVSWSVTRADPTILASIYPVASADPLRRTKADVLDTSIAAIGSVVDDARRTPLVTAAVRAILDGAHGIPLFEQAASVGLGRGVNGVRFDASSRPIFYDAEAAR